jgi:Tfp pilus tip-associated adhesin PilY1
MYNSDMCPNQSPAGKPEEDLYPRWPGDQNIVTHVVGFNHVNDLLRSTASNGGGQFYLSNNYEELSNKLQAALDEIFLREEQMMYNVFASPKQAVTAKSDLYGFKGTFIPQNGNTFWQGHLKCFQLAADGSFPDDSAANTKWDAFTKLVNTASADRKIYTFKYANEALTDSSNAFTAANILPTDLGLLAANTAGRDSVVNFIRGENGFGYKLGDIFHFNPIVVGSPLIWKGAFDQSYQDFYDDNVGRKEVVYVGTNDGMLHCFRVQKPDSEGNPDVSLGGEELWGFIPPSQLRRVKNLFLINALEILRNVPCAYAIPNPGDLCMTYGFDRYFVDGKAMVKDIKIGSEWKTVLIFGMGIGGTSYCALDVSDPDDPKFLWEFTTPLMGYTEARPIISAVNDGTSSYPAVFIPGGYDFWERPASAADPGSRTGKALYVLKAEPGAGFTPQIVKRFLWSATSTGEVDPPPDGIPTYTSTDFLYSFVAAPAVFDPNGDGIADYVYAPDTGDFRSGRPGGRIWKIPVLGDPDGWVPEKIFQAANSQVFFLSPTLGYDTDWNLWVYIGSGRRSQITANDGGHVCLDPLTGDPILDPITGLTTTCYTFTNTNGCFYAFWDKPTNPKPLDGSSATYFKDITALFGATPSDDEKKLASTQVGISFNYFRLAPEVIFEPTPILVNNVLTMNTYSPTVASGSTVCGNSTGFSGKHSIYQFTLGKIGSSIAITSTNAFGGKILGSGVLSSGEYIVYIGAETVGTFTPTGYYRPSLEDTFGPVLWKEEKQ